MIRILFLFLSFFTTATMAFSWQDLWYTHDQQGQLLMEKGQFAKAKDTFERNDWAAAAAYKSGDYQRAEGLYKELNTEDGYYNQGNALAHMGQYEQAIEAYNKALALNSKNQDAIYNRKLLQELMKKDKDKQQNKDQQNQDQQNQDQQNQDQQNKDQQNKDQQNKDQQNQDQQNQDQQNQDQQNKDQQNKDQQNQDQKNKDQQNQDQKNQEQKSKEEQNKDQQDQDQTKENHNNKQEENKKGDKNNAGEAQSAADREKQLAKEQWLRLIPDDPGGLMREKFLRDHIRRERGWYQ